MKKGDDQLMSLFVTVNDLISSMNWLNLYTFMCANIYIHFDIKDIKDIN